MHRPSIILAGWTAIFALAAAPAQAEDYTSSRGFSMTIPDGWHLVDADRAAEALRRCPRLARLAKGLDFNRVAMCAAKPEPGFARNINVVVEYQKLPMDEEGRAKYTKHLRSELAARGIMLDELTVDFTTLDGTRCLRGVFEWDVPGRDLTVKQMQVFLPAGAKTLVITCTASRDQFEETLPLFNRTLASFEVSTSMADIWYGLPKPVRWGLIGGVLGLGFALLRWFLGRPVTARRPTSLAVDYTPFGGTYCDREKSEAPPDAPDFSPVPPEVREAQAAGEERPRVTSRYEPPPWEAEETAALVAEQEGASD